MLIVGDTGFLGQHVVRAFKDEKLYYGMSGSGWRRYSSGQPESQNRWGDCLCSPTSNVIVSSSARQCAITPRPIARTRQKFISKNVAAFSSFAQLLLEQTPKQAILTSSYAVYGNMEGAKSEDVTISLSELSASELYYGGAKFHQEQMFAELCKRNGIEYSIVRVPSLYGPFSTRSLENAHVIPAFIMKAQKVEEGHVDAFGTGRESKEFLFAHDLACVYRLLTERQVGIINVSDGRFLSIREISDKISQMMDSNVEFRFAGTPNADVRTRQVSGKIWTNVP